jgi:hypothetical protein
MPLYMRCPSAPMAATEKALPEAECGSAQVMVAACRTDGDCERDHSFCAAAPRSAADVDSELRQKLVSIVITRRHQLPCIEVFDQSSDVGGVGIAAMGFEAESQNAPQHRLVTDATIPETIDERLLRLVSRALHLLLGARAFDAMQLWWSVARNYQASHTTCGVKDLEERIRSGLRVLDVLRGGEHATVGLVSTREHQNSQGIYATSVHKTHNKRHTVGR